MSPSDGEKLFFVGGGLVLDGPQPLAKGKELKLFMSRVRGRLLLML